MTTAPARRRSARTTITAVAAWALLATAVPAAAHTRLESSDPAAGQQLAMAPEQLRLEFSSGIDDRFARVALTPADGPPQELPVEVEGRVLVAQVPADVDPGAWRVDFRVVSADGHPVSGSVPFEVRAAAPSAVPMSTATPVPAPAATTAVVVEPAATADEDPAAVWPWVGGGALLLGGGVLLALRRRRAAD